MNNPLQSYNSLKDFWSPVGVSLITLYLTFVISRINTFLAERSRVKAKRLSYIDFFNLELNKLLSSFDTLLEDLDEGSVFQYKNIGSANTASQELKKMIKDVVIFSDEDLREKIINTVDAASTVAVHLQALEDLNKQWKQDYDNAISSADYETNNLRMELLKLDIGLDNNLRVVSLDNKKINPKTLTYISEIVQRINNKRGSAFSVWTNAINFTKDKRTVLSTRILDTKSKLVELSSEFDDLRDKTLKKKFFLF